MSSACANLDGGSRGRLEAGNLAGGCSSHSGSSIEQQAGKSRGRMVIFPPKSSFSRPPPRCFPQVGYYKNFFKKVKQPE